MPLNLHELLDNHEASALRDVLSTASVPAPDAPALVAVLFAMCEQLASTLATVMGPFGGSTSADVELLDRARVRLALDPPVSAEACQALADLLTRAGEPGFADELSAWIARAETSRGG